MEKKIIAFMMALLIVLLGVAVFTSVKELREVNDEVASLQNQLEREQEENERLLRNKDVEIDSLKDALDDMTGNYRELNEKYALLTSEAPEGEQAPENAESDEKEPVQETTEPTEPTEPEKPNAEVKLTIGMVNALKEAESYLDIMPFSYDGLIQQLEFEKFTHEEAVYAADHCGADWYEQAVKSAANYLKIMSFSKEGLIDQLVFEGFTREQAEYGVKENGYE